MAKKDNEEKTSVGSEEFIDSEEWKENLLKQGKWLRLLWMIGFSFIYYLSNASNSGSMFSFGSLINVTSAMLFPFLYCSTTAHPVNR